MHQSAAAGPSFLMQIEMRMPLQDVTFVPLMLQTFRVGFEGGRHTALPRPG